MFSNSNIDHYLENRLQEWADWFMRGNNHHLGYPKESSIGLFQKGTVLTKKKSYHPPITPTHESAEEVEKFIAEMSQQNRKAADALRTYYLNRKPTLSLEAKAFGVSEAQFRILLALARHWLAGRFTAQIIKGYSIPSF